MCLWVCVCSAKDVISQQYILCKLFYMVSCNDFCLVVFVLYLSSILYKNVYSLFIFFSSTCNKNYIYLSLTLSLPHSLSPSLSPALALSISLSLSLALSLSLSPSLSLSHSLSHTFFEIFFNACAGYHYDILNAVLLEKGEALTYIIWWFLHLSFYLSYMMNCTFNLFQIQLYLLKTSLLSCWYMLL